MSWLPRASNDWKGRKSHQRYVVIDPLGAAARKRDDRRLEEERINLDRHHEDRRRAAAGREREERRRVRDYTTRGTGESSSHHTSLGDDRLTETDPVRRRGSSDSDKLKGRHL